MKGEEMKKFEFYLKNKRKIHISCNSGRFYNGTIVSIDSKNKMILLEDDMLGEVPIFLDDIRNIDPFRKVTE